MKQYIFSAMWIGDEGGVPTHEFKIKVQLEGTESDIERSFVAWLGIASELDYATACWRKE